MLNSKEALEKIKERLFLKENDYVKTFIPCILKINQDLDRLEKLEKENQELRKAIKQWNINGGNLLKENTKLKKVIEILNYKLEIAPYHNKILDTYSVDFLRFDPPVSFNSNKKEYELLKEVL